MTKEEFKKANETLILLKRLDRLKSELNTQWRVTVDFCEIEVIREPFIKAVENAICELEVEFKNL